MCEEYLSGGCDILAVKKMKVYFGGSVIMEFDTLMDIDWDEVARDPRYSFATAYGRTTSFWRYVWGHGLGNLLCVLSGGKHSGQGHKVDPVVKDAFNRVVMGLLERFSHTFNTETDYNEMDYTTERYLSEETVLKMAEIASKNIYTEYLLQCSRMDMTAKEREALYRRNLDKFSWGYLAGTGDKGLNLIPAGLLMKNIDRILPLWDIEYTQNGFKPSLLSRLAHKDVKYHPVLPLMGQIPYETIKRFPSMCLTSQFIENQELIFKYPDSIFNIVHERDLYEVSRKLGNNIIGNSSFESFLTQTCQYYTLNHDFLSRNIEHLYGCDLLSYNEELFLEEDTVRRYGVGIVSREQRINATGVPKLLDAWYTRTFRSDIGAMERALGYTGGDALFDEAYRLFMRSLNRASIESVF